VFDWLRPTPPVGPEDKEWLERRMDWLTREFGAERLLEVPVVLPTPDFFPDPYDGSRRAAARVFRRVCRYMDVDPEGVSLRFFRDRKPAPELGLAHQGAAGLYEGAVIRVEEATLQDPLALIGTMAHELAHVHLLGGGRVSAEEEDHEALTDLLTVYLGLGVFTANSVIREQGGEIWWAISRLGYLTMDMYGYAFALFAWYRGEAAPAWAKHLRGDVYAPFRKGLKYLTKTGDSAFKPLRLR
jgi:hypothetical protein